MGYAPQVEDALRLIDQNNKKDAQRILAKHLQANPRDEDAWLWLAYILPTRPQQLQALGECMKYFPDSRRAQHGLDLLRLGVPMDAPNLFSDIPAEAEAFHSRSFPPAPASTTASAAKANRKTGTLPDEAPEPTYPYFQAEEEPEEEAPPRYLVPEADRLNGLDWLREESLATPPTLPPAAPAFPRHPASRATPSRPARKPSKLFNPAQVGCITILVLLLLAILCGGLYAIFSSPPMSDLIPCFEAVLNGESPCLACPPAAQDCPECPEPPDCAPPATTLPPADLPPAVTATLVPIEPEEPVLLPTELPAAAPSLSLPAPLYFISEESGSAQIWRLAQDGSLSMLTSEAAPITAFDVSPTDGQLAYVSSNSLHLTSPNGGSRVTLLTGQELPGIDDPSYWSVLISTPLWSPDGAQLAFAQDGIQVIRPLTGEIKPLVSNVYVPEKPTQALIYAPLSWSPEGSRLAVSMTQEACASLGILSTQGGSSLELDAVPTGAVWWLNDSASMLVANPYTHCTCQHGSGLYRVDPLSGASQVLQGGLTAESTPAGYLGWPKLMADGTLLYFYGELPGPTCAPGWPASALLSMVVGVGERWDFRMPLRTDSYLIGEALWSPDGSLAVIRDQTQSAEGRNGPLLILYSDGRLAVELKVSGRSLHWGMPAP